MTKLIPTKDGPPIIPFIGEIRNRLNKDTGRFGLFFFGDYEFGAENSKGRDFDGVYQMRECREGKVAVKMRFQKTREETATPARVANWNKFAAAVSAWHSLTDEQKAVYNNLALKTNKTGFNIFIGEYMLS